MKVSTQTANASAGKETDTPSWKGTLVKTLSVIVLTVVGTYLVTSLYLTDSPGSMLWNWATARGHGVLGDDARLSMAIAGIPRRLMQFAKERPRLVIDIKFKHMQKLDKRRVEALEKGLLIQGLDDFIPASIRHGGRTIKVKLRLKGDFTDHLEGEKWSLRIHVKGRSQILGMRRFSIQHPKVRGYQGEALFFETLRHLGILAPRYFFVDVVVNGNDLGIMALEEHFSKEMLESNGRRDNPIIRFDESLYWAELGGNESGSDAGFAFGGYRNAAIDGFGSMRMMKSERLSREYATAVGLLRGFVRGELSASEVFDVELLGRFLGAAELWGAWHAVRWHNLRFYLNPFTARLEPIGFDAEVHIRKQTRELVVRNEELTDSMLNDPEILAVYRRSLFQLGKEVLEGGLLDKLKRIEKQHLPGLQKEFFLLQGFPYEDLSARAKYLLTLSDTELKKPAPLKLAYPALIHAYLEKDEEGAYLEVTNAVPYPVAIQAVRWVAHEGNGSTEFRALSTIDYPLVLGAAPSGFQGEARRFYYRPGVDSEGHFLQIQANIVGQERHYTVEAKLYHSPLKLHPIPESSVDEQMAQHPFLSFDRDSGGLHVRRGQWEVKEWLVVPAGSSLTIPAGTNLRFLAEVGLIAHGPLYFEGSNKAGIRLEGPSTDEGEGGWQGIVVLGAGSTSRWNHVIVRSTTGIDHRGWQTTGGVTFYESDVEMDECMFQGNRAEDALNIVHSKFRLKDVRIVDTASDGFDADFTNGTIEGGVFENIGEAGGGDGVDISGSVVKIVGTQFSGVSDKALSVGERSMMTASRLGIEAVGTGAASKDGSNLELTDSALEQVRNVGLMAYIKKPEFGPGRIDARNVTLAGSTPLARAQKGSVIIIDGVQIEGEDLDVAQLYETTMRPGLRK